MSRRAIRGLVVVVELGVEDEKTPEQVAQRQKEAAVLERLEWVVISGAEARKHLALSALRRTQQ